MACKHKLKAHAKVTPGAELESDEHVLELRVACTTCGEAFAFDGLPVGISVTEPRVSFDATRARLPIRPQSAMVASYANASWN